MIDIDLNKLDIFGEEYISQFVYKKAKEKSEFDTFKMYVCESLRLKGENKYLSVKYTDLISGNHQEKQKLKSEDVIENIKKKFR